MKITHNKKITASTEWDNGWSKRHDSNSDSDYYVFSCPKATAYVTETDGGVHAEVHFRAEQIRLETDFTGDDACDRAMHWAEKRIFSKDVVASTDVCAHRAVDIAKDDLSWIKGLYWSEDWHEFTVTSVDPAKLTCEITEEWISEDTDKDCRHTSKYTICTDDGGSLLFVSKKYPEYMKFYAQNAFNYRELVPKEIDELAFLDDDPEEVDTLGQYEDEYYPDSDDDDYTPSATRGDYSPSNPWDAPGMSIHDFI